MVTKAYSINSTILGTRVKTVHIQQFIITITQISWEKDEMNIKFISKDETHRNECLASL